MTWSSGLCATALAEDSEAWDEVTRIMLDSRAEAAASWSPDAEVPQPERTPVQWESEDPLADWELDLLLPRSGTEREEAAAERIRRRVAGGEKIPPGDPDILVLAEEARAKRAEK